MKVRRQDAAELVSLKTIMIVEDVDEDDDGTPSSETDLTTPEGTYAIDSYHRVWKLDKVMSELLGGFVPPPDDDSIGTAPRPLPRTKKKKAR